MQRPASQAPASVQGLHLHLPAHQSRTKPSHPARDLASGYRPCIIDHRSCTSCSYSRDGDSGRTSGGQAYVDDPEQQQRAYRPPPPPGPLPRAAEKKDNFYTLKMVVAGAAVSLGWGLFVQTQLPDIKTDEFGVRYVNSAAGSKVVVGEDSRRRMYFMDERNNLYYDSGNKEVGWFQVTDSEDVYNMWLPNPERPDQMESKLLGKLSDLETVGVDAVAGIPFREMRREANGRYNGTMTMFKDDGPRREMPPNAGLKQDEQGRMEGPPILDELEIRKAGKRK